jgi:integrase
MPKPLYPHVEKNKNRHGRLRFYFRQEREKGTARIRLPDAYGSADFMAAYQACLAGQPLPALPGQGLAIARKASRGKLGWLIKLYLQSAEFARWKPATKGPRRNMLEKLAEEKGAFDFEDIDRAAIIASMEARRETIDMANSWLTTVRNMFDWATRETLPGDPLPILDKNPCEFVKRFTKTRSEDPDEEEGHPTWSDEDLARFEAAYPHGARQRLIYEVLLCTGLRAGDASRVGRQHLKGDVLQLKTEKTGAVVTLRVLPRLKHALEVGPKGLDTELAFITGKNRRAMVKGYLGEFLGEACQKIGLDRSAHGLRKAAARRYAEAGATTSQLMSIFGWKTSDMAEKYTRAVDRAKAALKAMDDFVLDGRAA